MDKEASLHNSLSEEVTLLPKQPSKKTPSLYPQWPKPIALVLRFRSRFILTTEPVLFLFMFGLILEGSVLQQYFFNRYGQNLYRDSFNYTGEFNFCINAEILDQDLGNGTADHVSKQASYLSLVAGVIGQLPGIIATLLYGPLSDRIGRKPIMIIVPTASCITAVLLLLLMYLEWPVEAVAVISAVNGLSGGLPGMLTVVFAYIADVTSKRWLTLRLGIMESMIFTSGSLAVLISGQWLSASDCTFTGLMFLYLSANIAIIVYTLLWLPKSLTSVQRKEKLKNTTLFKVVTRGFKLLVTKEYCRWKLWLGVTAMFVAYLAAVGSAEINTLFLIGYPLHWLPSTIGLYQALNQFVHGLGLILLLPLLVAVGAPDALIMLVGVIWAAAFNVAIGFVQLTWQMFLVGVLQGVEVIGFPPLRSIMSKTVAPNDQGALFSMIATAQVVASTFGTVIVFFLLPWITTVQHWPAGHVYFFIAAINVILWPIALILLKYRKRTLSPDPPPIDEVDGPLDESTLVQEEHQPSALNELSCSAPLSSNALYYGSTITPANTDSEVDSIPRFANKGAVSVQRTD